MEIKIEVPFSFDLFIALQREVPPDGVTMHVPPLRGQRDMMSMIVWDPITIEVGKFIATNIGIPLFVNWLYERFKQSTQPPKITIRRRVVEFEKDALKRAIEEELTIER